MRMHYLGTLERIDDKTAGLIRELQETTFDEPMMEWTEIVFHHWWLLKDEQEIAGFCSLHIYTDMPDTAFLSLAGIMPDYRGKGLQKRLIRHRVKFAKAQGAKRVISYTAPDNLASANNLIKCGFKLYSPIWEWGVAHALYFEKKL